MKQVLVQFHLPAHHNSQISVVIGGSIFFPLLRSENLTPFLHHLDNVTCHFEAGSTIWNPFGHKCKRLWDFQHCRSCFCPCLKELPQSNLLFVPLKAFQLNKIFLPSGCCIIDVTRLIIQNSVIVSVINGTNKSRHMYLDQRQPQLRHNKASGC